VRDGIRRLRTGLWVAVAVSVAAGVSSAIVIPDGSRPAGSARPAAGQNAAASGATVEHRYAAVLKSIGATSASATGNAVAEATAAREAAGQTEVAAAHQAGVLLPGTDGSSASAVQAVSLSAKSVAPRVRPLSRLRPADLLIVAPATLPAATVSAIRKLSGVAAANVLDAARIQVNGGYVATLGVNPSTFRDFTAKPTAKSTVLWQNVAAGGVAVSYLMGQQEKIPLGGTVKVVGARTEEIRVGGFGTVGISGVDAVVSDSVARSLGMPAGNAIVVSAPDANLSALIRQITHTLPKGASVAPLVGQAATSGLKIDAGWAGAIGVTSADGPGLTAAQTKAFLTVALEQVGKRYVWGGDGPDVFDCSGLVQWSLRQIGIVMPRVAVNQAQTGPRVQLSDLQPGDLLFYHTDPTAPTYISHVAIYIGKGLMLQAPEPGEDVQVVPAIFSGGFAGAVAIYPRIAAAVAADPAG
jgi:peptidoglycan DL-endopeptidase CwlO